MRLSKGVRISARDIKFFRSAAAAAAAFMRLYRATMAPLPLVVYSQPAR